jgi:amino acid adenylation domain-containing protein
VTEPTVRSESGAATVAGLLRFRAAERPAQVAFTFLNDGESTGESLTYGELDARAARIAAELAAPAAKAAKVAPGERALLLYPPGLDFIAAFFGCLYAGVVAVPAYPPRPNDRSQSRLRAIARDATPKAALTTRAILAGAVEPRGLLAVAPELAGVRWLATDAPEVSGGMAEAAAELPEPDAGDVAFLQYTSGSTAAPKGVMVTHANLLHNERMIGQAFAMDEASVVVGWLPLYHDMGLIGNVLQPLAAGGRCVLMSPVAFLQRPMRWLEAISRFRGTVSGGPNFAYELCLRKATPEALLGLDLASWRVAFNGAEPVRAATLERFAAAFAPCGFQAASFYPCYGLAEATLFVTGGEPGRAPRVDAEGGRVSCGRPWLGQRLVVADAETGEERPAGAEGEIWLSGPSVARGYWRNPEATVHDFNAFLPDGEGPFLRTGDLGFLAGGELYVTGRLKDLIILRGRNLYPQDVELTAERSHPDLRPGGAAAFAVDAGDAGEERLVIVHEVERRRQSSIAEIAEAVRRAVAAEHEAQVHEVVLIRQSGLPKTSSGKVQRRRCRDLYLQGELPVEGRSALAAADPAPEIAAELATIPSRDDLAALELPERRAMLAAYLRERAAAVLGVPAGAIASQPLTALGLDSLSAVELKGSVEAAFGPLGMAVPLADLLQGIGVEELAERMLDSAAAAGSTAAAETLPLRALGLAGDQPLSEGQRGLWFLHRLAPEGGAYNVAVAARAQALDPAAFARALAALAARHESLRTVFPLAPLAADEPVQRVLAEPRLDFAVEDAAGWSERELAHRLGSEAWRPFALDAGPLLRARVFLRNEGEAVVLLVVHHIVADFASLAVMAEELAVLYRQPEANLPPPALRYSDFVRWQVGTLAGPRGERLWSYWRDQLAGVPDLDLPADRPRPPVQTWRGGARAAAIPPALAGSLRELAAAHGATLFMTLLAAFAAQLARITGQEDFAVGAPVAGRPVPELARLVGYFVNVLPLRADLSGEPGFEQVLARIRRTALAGMEHAGLPFPRIAQGLRPVPDPARPPIFQVLLVLQSRRPQDPPGLAPFSLGEAGARLALGGLELESVRLEERRAQFDLTLRLAERADGGLGISLEHNADRFDGATAERMLGHFLTLLAGVSAGTAAPEISIWHLPLLAPAERRQVIETWNATAHAFPRDLLLHQLFEAQAARTPEAEALVVGELRLTYGELNRRANRLAHRLRRLGVRPEERVGICLQRSARMLVSLLAVLKAGGAYLPLDPAYPRERLALLLEDSAARVVIGEAATAPRLAAEAEASGIHWLSLDAATDRAGDEESEENPAPVAAPGNLAYLIYTSGSTGRPKAVAVEHRSVVGLMHWARESFTPAELASVLAATSIGFDVSVFEIFVPLSWGGRLVLAENLLAWPALPAAREVRMICAVPSVVAELVHAGRFPDGVRTVNLAGEAVPPALAPELAAAAPGARLLDIYGPTESTVYATWAPLVPGREVTIGLPVANTRAHVTDARGEAVPAGVPGELCLGGDGLARGYLGRPELTAERFVPDPFAIEPGGRLYRTGDLARRRADGRLDYLGRLDQQVKVRGFRVELGEVEAALRRHPRLRDAVVVARPDGDRGQRLIAYFVAANPVEGEALPVEELRAFLRRSLPDYMVPALFVSLDALPLSANGKVDRRALPEPGTAAGAAPTASGPRAPLEELLAGAFAEVLGVEGVGPQDDFFALGGHSLLATRLLARVTRLFGVDLPVSSVFLHPTPAALARLIAAGSGAAAAPPVRPLPRSPGLGLPLSFAQRRLWFLDRMEPESAAYHMAGALDLSGPLDLAALARALAAVAVRHEVLRTVFRNEGGEPVQTAAPPGAAPIFLPLADLAALPPAAAGAETERLAVESALLPFDLERGPLWRVLAVRRGPLDHRLALTLHHIVADGWSLGILIAELHELYAAFVAGALPVLPELPVQYADWAVWQRERLLGAGAENGGMLAAEVAWWRQRLAGAADLELPADRPRPPLRSGRGGTRAAALPAGVSTELERLARREGGTPFMLLLAAWQAQLARYTGAPAIPVGSPVANRGRGEIAGLIGFFVNMLVLRTEVAGNPDFRALLARVREVALSAYAHQDVPFERLVEELRPERRQGRNPLFQVAFQLEEPLALARLGEAAARVRRLETGTAKLDLLLSVVREREGFAATLEYDADLFDAATAERMLGHWHRLAAGIVENPRARLSDLPLLTAAEAAQIAGWTGAKELPGGYPRDATIHGLFAEQAWRAPQAVALAIGEERISYGELEARANRLARRLRRLGVGPEAPVGLCLERSAGLIVGMLGVLKAGGAYVPLDPEYPAERLAFLAADTGLATVVVAEGSPAALPSGLARVPLAAGGELAPSPGAPGESAEPLPELAGPLSLAYVVYTSGSTGRPKGVEAVHRSVVRLVRGTGHGTGYAPFGPEEVFLHLAPPAFDAATYEVWGALLNGGRLAILPGRAPSLAELEEALIRHGVTSAFLTSGLFHQAVELRLEGLRGLRSLLAGGDVMSPELMRRAVAGLPGCRVANAYGPTENTTFSTCQPLPAAAGVPSPVPIGRPIAHSTVELLDADFNPVPVGVPGDLYTGGDGLARGYRGRPELTAERFVPAPGNLAGGRLYATGDLARWRPDGSLEFLGRRDQQVKIRGFRVEPSEIEAALARHPGVADAAVVVRDEAGGKALAAYVVPRAPQGGESLPEDFDEVLREHLRAVLPEYMLPAHLIALPALPLNANAKVDRRALAARAVRSAGDDPRHEAPRTPVEERLAAIWSEVLGVERIGVHDDFFALGGHSLLAIRALARIGEAFGVDLPVGELFAAPTVATLAARLAAGPQPVAPAAEARPAAPMAPIRRAVPAVELPRTPLEAEVAAIWREVLGIEEIGIHDDFFALGGHSLLAHRVAMRVARRMGIELDLRVHFEIPTVAAVAREIAELQTGGASAAATATVVRGMPPAEVFPLSLAQQRLWLIDRLEPGSPGYNVPVAVRLRGPLAVGPLLEALAAIVRRHEPLRTVYAVADEEPVQVVLPAVAGLALPFARLDLRGLPAAAREETLRRALREEGARPFDLARGPVSRFLLVDLTSEASEDRVLLVTIHHIATDGWSMSIFFRELAALYADFAAGRPASLPEPTLRYADWAAWQRRALASGALDAQIDSWRRELADLPVLELPADHPRAQVQTSAAEDRGALRPVALPAELLSPFRGAAWGGGITPFTVLLGGYLALLARLSGQDDLAVGIPAAGRRGLQTEELIGFFVNTLVLRSKTGDDPGFAALLGRVRDSVLAAQGRQDVPLDRLVEELQPDRSAGLSPFFQVMFTYLANPLAPVAMPGIDLTLVDVEAETAKYDLTLSVYDGGESLRAWLEYRTSRFDAATVDRWMGHLRTLLASAAADPARPLSALPLLSPAERRQLLDNAAGPDLEAEVPGLLHQLFERSAAATPGAPALLMGAGEPAIPYGELNARANRLARFLVALGAGPEVAVGVCLDRTPEMIVALLAALKSGGIYVPLDPAYPPDRLEYMLADSGARVLVTRAGLPVEAAAGGEVRDLRVARIDGDRERIAALAADDLGTAIDAENLAYLIYTSGSTGRPKGVEIPHGPAARHCEVTRRVYGHTPDDRVLQVSSMSFDTAIETIFSTFAAGATLVFRGEEVWAGVELAARVAGLGVTATDLPTSLFHGWALDPEALAIVQPTLRLVETGGEEMLVEAARLWGRSGMRGVRLLNGYGPTETVITATQHAVDPAGEPDGSSVALGRPMAERTIHVLAPALDLQPLGVEGEAWFSGLLARGYRGRPDLTAASFLPDPFSEVPGERLYRSGDLTRRRPDGSLFFLGRRDGQVKIRGFRVETGEVESALLAHPEIREAVVQAPLIAGERRIAAWIVPAREGEIPAGLPAFLRERLPVYMVPSYFTAVAAMPLTPNGKVDRRALPAPVLEVAAEAAGEGRALTPMAELLAGVWRDLLGVERVGAGDNFFALGGHSLVATRLASRLRSLFGVELPLAAIFEEPTLEALAARVTAALGETPPAMAPPIVATPRDPAGDPLSFAQKRLWFLHRLDPESPAYNVPGALGLRGALAPGALAAALAEIVRRHQALRTVFHVSDGAPGEPVQVVMPQLSPETAAALPLIDLAGVLEPARRAEAARILDDEGQRPFDLEHGPLLRTQLIRLGAEEHLLAVMMHHIVSDAWSLGVTVRELSALYGAALAGEPSPLPELAVQYADFARWQRAWLSGELLADELEHWRRTLDGAPEALELPTDRPRPAPLAPAGHLPVALSPELAAELTALGRRQGWTLFMTLLAAFDALLARWSGQRDLVIGAPIANRHHQEVEGLIGFFTNTLALRLDLAGDPAFAEAANRARAAMLTAQAHQELPFERLVEELAPERDLSRTPLFQVMLVVQHDPAAGLALPGLATELIDVELGTAKFDLTLFLVADGGGIGGHLELNRGLFDLATGERFLGHFLTLLAGAIADPAARLSQLPLLTPAERQELIAWTAPRDPHPEARCIHELVAEQAARHPGSAAVVFAGESLTYGELMRRSAALAGRLHAAGVGPDVPVGLYLERSLDMMVAVLAVLRAGGAYVPLDPTYPAGRLRLMLEDAGAPVVVTHAPLAGAVPAGGAAVVRADAPLGRDEGEAEIPSGVLPGNLAYVTYTSGSTGRPKGVAMTHAALTAMLAWQLRTSSAGGGRTLQYTSLSFDVSFQEIFATWCAGGTLVLVSEETRRDPAALVRLLAEERVERLFQPFVALQQLAVAAAAAADGPLPESLREVMSAGEQLHVTPQLAALFGRLPGSRLYNHYGPSETHAVTWLALDGDPAGWPESPSIGRPVDHARVFLLDPDFQPVPAGVPGELWAGGACLARGYMRPDLTAERFLPDPFDWAAGWAPGGRLYRTGDLARRLPSGELEFLGRRDHQVKVRGHRVETAEVELALARQPAVLQAAVVVRGDSAGAKRLVAYVVFRDDLPVPSSGELRAALAETLPDPLVPTAWARLDRLPMTPSGKLDRRALARLHPADLWSGDEGFVAPRNPAEELLAGIWMEVLGVDRVGIHDEFFQLGGHSLLATQVASRVREAFGIELPLRRIFEAPSLAALAAAVTAARAAGATETAPPLRPEPRQGDLPLSFGQERLWFLHRLQPESPAYNIPLALRTEGALDPARLAAALGEVVRRHEVLRTVYAERDGEARQVVLPAAAAAGVPLPVIDLGALPAARREGEARSIAAEEAERPFDLEHGPLLRALLVVLAPRAPQRQVLLLDIHHIATDGWSMGVLVREVTTLYAGEALPELPVQYADFALWQRRRLAGETLAAQLSWWREALSGAPALDLMADYPRPAVMTQRGADHPFALGGELSRGVSELARREGVTPFMVLAAALFTLLSRLTGQRDLTIGSPIANRNHLETEGLIGFFVNTLVLRAGLARAASFRDLLRQVREKSLGAYAHQDLPFEKLVDELQPVRDLSRSPLFQVALALQNTPLPAADLGGVRLRGEEIPSGISKFDLSFAFNEEAEGRLAGILQYATDLFAPATAARYARQLTILLAGLVAEPGGRLDAAPLLAAAERHQILQEWNDTRRAWPGDPTLHQLFEAWADRQPEALAGFSAAGSITYGELETRANRLAHHLRSLSVGRSQPVGLWMGRTLDLLTGVLGILKAGGAYVPLDAAWPADRVETILAGAGIQILIAGPSLAEGGFPGSPGLRVVRLDDPSLAAASAARPASVSDAGDLAYLIHTSGSTGEPKGIAVRHRSAANTLRWNNETLGIRPGDRHLFVNSIGFDLSIYDLLGMLGAGAAVRVASEEELRDPGLLAAVLRGEHDEAITTWNSSPAALQRLADLFPPPPAAGESRTLRRVLLAGDWIPLTLPDRVWAAFPGALIGNFGGATETSVWSNWYRVDAVDPAWPAIPYGRPIANVRYYVLDARLEPCPPGVPGDNYIGGGSPAVGYAGQAALTAERFLPDPYADEPGGRMYATGDRARYGADGNLEFLGRLDDQVKVRGYRIELGEIESALTRHPAVRTAVVVAREDVPGEKRLVGYVVPAEPPVPAMPTMPEIGELRAFLLETLPEYMVPWAFVELPALPVTANGKLDRDALPAPRAVAADPAAYVAPRNDLERAIGAVWREVLQLDRVGVRESFFEAGGSSLLIARLQSRLRQAIGRDIPFVELFRHPTIESLARSLEGGAPQLEEKAESVRARTETRRESMRQLQQARGQRRSIISEKTAEKPAEKPAAKPGKKS